MLSLGWEGGLPEELRLIALSVGDYALLEKIFPPLSSFIKAGLDYCVAIPLLLISESLTCTYSSWKPKQKIFEKEEPAAEPSPESPPPPGHTPPMPLLQEA